MIPLHQILFHTLAAGAMLLLAAYNPLVLKKPISRWGEMALVAGGLVLIASAGFAIALGHWPFDNDRLTTVTGQR
jgi:hypothetical protein